MDFNKAIIVGRLTKDPETRTTTSGQTVATFSVATGTVFTNKAGEKQEKTEFHNIVAWGKVGEICGQYLTKGQEVLIEGRIETRSWDDPSGQKKYRTEINVENMRMGAKSRGGEGGGFSKPGAGSSAPSRPSGAPANEPAGMNDEEEIKIEDIPF